MNLPVGPVKKYILVPASSPVVHSESDVWSMLREGHISHIATSHQPEARDGYRCYSVDINARLHEVQNAGS